MMSLAIELGMLEIFGAIPAVKSQYQDGHKSPFQHPVLVII